MSIDLTVAIVTYNGEQRIPEVLDYLLNQEIDGISWEVLAIDNNSNDGTRNVILEYAKNWRSDSCLRYVFEQRQGAAYARYRAMNEAKSESLVAFLDDDNLPGKNWVSECIEFGREKPKAGAYGGIIHCKLDKDPPSYFSAMKAYLTIFNRGGVPFQYKQDDKIRRIPPGPGIVIRKQTWNDAMPDPDRLLIPGRDEQTMAGGEDAEMAFYIQNSSWEVWHNPKMEVWHHIYPHRLEEDYLLKLARGYGLSNHLTRLARYDRWQRPLVNLMIPFYVIRDSLKSILFYYQHQADLNEDFAKKCALESKIGQAWSPLLGVYKVVLGWNHKS
ncbi:hormogonium polysaccharide biosynthesis glycosyltransferase HpsE [Roseofilum casamattae]|uniref:Hormogonium polysaccharide biosynthesis glycosyltransferase HpsE n=1 Tax=Roseofilum casamattae BLCC-M143 TaxID=3022442 RepID=A0ABT7BZD8_9CYAN|nr:hormogonium polysaccharide biosynthesis glycosyltransferase HpsE [Roseofilum casamattae]MDJ1183638.1 hormogonium polysaccharide biosynthesis glycosyltransferase HpsE [Roseofilum casamattae BLCC-M143]